MKTYTSKAGMGSANQTHLQILAGYIGERPSVRASNQSALNHVHDVHRIASKVHPSLNWL